MKCLEVQCHLPTLGSHRIRLISYKVIYWIRYRKDSCWFSWPHLARLTPSTCTQYQNAAPLASFLLKLLLLKLLLWDRLTFMLMQWCLHCCAPDYLVKYCCVKFPPNGVFFSACWNLLCITRHQLSMFSRQAFAVAGPTAWKSLPDRIRDPNATDIVLGVYLKTFLVCMVLVQ